VLVFIEFRRCTKYSDGSDAITRISNPPDLEWAASVVLPPLEMDLAQ
jgi:hypothetical protein